MAKPLTDQIEHVVVLMLENRSFDNVFGGLYPHLVPHGQFRGLTGKELNPLDPKNPSKGSVKVFQGAPGTPTWIMPYPDPGELYTDMVEQIFGKDSTSLPSGVLPPMTGFAWNYSRQEDSPKGDGWPAMAPVPLDIMQYYSAATMPWSWYLAQQYAVCDSWFASGPVQTIANRVFAHCGTPSKMPGTNLSRINNPDYIDSISHNMTPPVTDQTIFELFDIRWPDGISGACSEWDPGNTNLNWKVYYHDAPLSALCQYAYNNWCYDYFYGGNIYYYNEYTSNESNFEYDIRTNQLPKYSFIEPCYSDFFSGSVANSNHPGGAGIDWNNYNGQSMPPPIFVTDGENLLAEIYNTLLKYPDVFAKTLLIVTYDEHGGTYDHVPPPDAVSPFDKPVTNFNYDRYGVRVPTIFIHPWIKPGTIYPNLPRADAAAPVPHLDHTSLISTLTAQFDLKTVLTPRSKVARQITNLIPTTPQNWKRPAPPVYPLGLGMPRPVSPKRGPITHIPKNAPTLAGALGHLYKIEERRRAVRKAKRP